MLGWSIVGRTAREERALVASSPSAISLYHDGEPGTAEKERPTGVGRLRRAEQRNFKAHNVEVF
jgi:hypothetical protein